MERVPVVEVEVPVLRADAARNRARLLAVATRAFAAAEVEPSMRAIAREAGVGIGTLYRHFPTQEALVEAVYRDQVERLVEGARDLLAERSPADALRGWMDLFVNWVATKHGMLGTLTAMIDAGEIAHAQTRDVLNAAVETIVDAGRRAGDLRPDAVADDVVAGLIGITMVASHDRGQAARLLDVLTDGFRGR